jgi:hypothetical protein
MESSRDARIRTLMNAGAAFLIEGLDLFKSPIVWVVLFVVLADVWLAEYVGLKSNPYLSKRADTRAKGAHPRNPSPSLRLSLFDMDFLLLDFS